MPGRSLSTLPIELLFKILPALTTEKHPADDWMIVPFYKPDYKTSLSLCCVDKSTYSCLTPEFWATTHFSLDITQLERFLLPAASSATFAEFGATLGHSISSLSFEDLNSMPKVDYLSLAQQAFTRIVGISSDAVPDLKLSKETAPGSLVWMTLAACSSLKVLSNFPRDLTGILSAQFTARLPLPSCWDTLTTLTLKADVNTVPIFGCFPDCPRLSSLKVTLVSSPLTSVSSLPSSSSALDLSSVRKIHLVDKVGEDRSRSLAADLLDMCQPSRITLSETWGSMSLLSALADRLPPSTDTLVLRQRDDWDEFVELSESPSLLDGIQQLYFSCHTMDDTTYSPPLRLPPSLRQIHLHVPQDEYKEVDWMDESVLARLKGNLNLETLLRRDLKFLTTALRIIAAVLESDIRDSQPLSIFLDSHPDDSTNSHISISEFQASTPPSEPDPVLAGYVADLDRAIAAEGHLDNLRHRSVTRDSASWDVLVSKTSLAALILTHPHWFVAENDSELESEAGSQAEGESDWSTTSSQQSNEQAQMEAATSGVSP